MYINETIYLLRIHFMRVIHVKYVLFRYNTVRLGKFYDLERIFPNTFNFFNTLYIVLLFIHFILYIIHILSAQTKINLKNNFFKRLIIKIIFSYCVVNKIL